MYHSVFFSHLVMCPSVDIHPWSCITLLLFSFGHVYLCCYYSVFMYPLVDIHICHLPPCSHSNFVMYHCTDSHIWSCITMFLFSLGHVSHDVINSLSLISMLIVSLRNVSPLCYSHLVMYPQVATLTWSYFAVLIFTLVHVSLHRCNHLIMGPHFNIFTGPCITVLILTFDHVSLFSYSHFVYIYTWLWIPVAILTWLCIPVFLFSLGHVSLF